MKINFIENIPWVQRVVDYRLVDNRGMTKGDEYKGLEFLKEEITKAREGILEHSMHALLSSPNSFQLCLVIKITSLFINEEIGLELDLRLACLKIFWIHHKMLKQLELWFLKSAEREKFYFPCQMSSKENKFSFFSLSPRFF